MTDNSKLAERVSNYLAELRSVLVIIEDDETQIVGRGIGIIQSLQSALSQSEARVLELEGKARNLIHLHMCEQEGILCGMPSPQQFIKAVDELAGLLPPQHNPEVTE
jgi:hypothetical protein